MKTWQELIHQESTKNYFQNIRTVMANEAQQFSIWPKPEHIFRAFSLCPLAHVKVVIIGQDPYHGFNQATGLAFSVAHKQALPPSLKNIFKEMCSDLKTTMPVHGDLSAWARQGVLLLNSALSVREGQPNSHQNIGWRNFTEQVLHTLNEHERPIIFVLWGAYAQKLALPLLQKPQHGIIVSAHPSPLSAARGFFGSAPFSRINNFLTQHHLTPIHWEMNDDQ